ncbi:uncharacterized protein BJ171DRAFT_509581 [Polychytrium aggregatum]|uniref:uncharacterized protein n=1 Tax=Polychytrium aggregatum TaxID=110093 RepID=UPI0022FEDBC3|nr:uncharacterized protein BJ171DRAFT_509581 [Polychytrium aggregatum]KAI9203399.1 hypothetical protein BJ171DRAFT_509581 [Polychytrium aggregatum]
MGKPRMKSLGKDRTRRGGVSFGLVWFGLVWCCCKRVPKQRRRQSHHLRAGGWDVGELDGGRDGSVAAKVEAAVTVRDGGGISVGLRLRGDGANGWEEQPGFVEWERIAIGFHLGEGAVVSKGGVELVEGRGGKKALGGKGQTFGWSRTDGEKVHSALLFERGQDRRRKQRQNRVPGKGRVGFGRRCLARRDDRVGGVEENLIASGQNGRPGVHRRKGGGEGIEGRGELLELRNRGGDQASDTLSLDIQEGNRRRGRNRGRNVECRRDRGRRDMSGGGGGGFDVIVLSPRELAIIRLRPVERRARFHGSRSQNMSRSSGTRGRGTALGQQGASRAGRELLHVVVVLMTAAGHDGNSGGSVYRGRGDADDGGRVNEYRSESRSDAVEVGSGVREQSPEDGM